jgi:hypothetical protein
MLDTDDRDRSLLELAQETDRLAASITDRVICSRLHEIALELQEWGRCGAD